MSEKDRILYPNEIEIYLESLQTFDVPNVGSARWFNQQERIYKLSLQASVEAKSGGEEIVKEFLVTYEKVLLLVHELIAVELWRLNVFPLLLEMEIKPTSVIPLYMVLYNEVTIVSFLEAVLFHEDVMQSAYDAMIDLIDYCYRSAAFLKNFKYDKDHNNPDSSDAKIQLEQQTKSIQFESGMKCISILSYMAQHLKIISLSALHRLLAVHDIPLLFTSLICEPPWLYDKNSKIEKYCDGKWTEVTQKNCMKLNKVEGQLWIALIQLLLEPNCQKKYDINDFRKEQLLKLRSKLNDIVIDQIPVLNELLRFLEYLNLFDAPAPKSGIIIEQIPDIWENIHMKNANKWKDIAKMQKKKYFCFSESELQNFCKRLHSSFDLKNIEAMLTDTPVCANCGCKGEKRCSRCKNEWYCGRPCQVSHWARHKSACDLMISE